MHRTVLGLLAVVLMAGCAMSRSSLPAGEPVALTAGEPGHGPFKVPYTTAPEPPPPEPPPPAPPSSRPPSPPATDAAGEPPEDTIYEFSPRGFDGGGAAIDAFRRGAALRRTPSELVAPLETITVFYGTNRARTPECAGVGRAPAGACTPNAFYGGAEARPLPAAAAGGPPLAALEVGTLSVTIPPGHKVGAVERPLEVWKVRFSEKAEKHVVLAAIEPAGATAADHARWVERIRGAGASEAFVYIHGYANAFDDAARRAAQIAEDLDFRGLPMMYSWPSEGATASYLRDEPLADLACDSFDAFLELVQATGIRDLHVVAHSMGNRLIAEALYRRSLRGDSRRPIAQLVLAAPDIDAGVFERRFAGTLPRLARRVTLYVSDRDRALLASEAPRDRPRAGQRRSRLLGLTGFDTIDASDVETDFLSHAYFADAESVLADLHCLFQGSPASGRQVLAAVAGPLGPAWRVLPIAERGDGVDLRRCPPPEAAAVPPSLTPPPPEAAAGRPTSDRRRWFVGLLFTLALAAAALLIAIFVRLGSRSG